MDQEFTTEPKPFCFVLMPFSEEFRDVYQLGIRGACAEAGAHCERVDEQIHDGTILEQVYNQIAKADFIVAEMTGRNPNVFYEVGYAHALGKRTVLLTKAANDIPFDLKQFPHIAYGDSIATLKAKLTERVRWYVDNPAKRPEDDQIGIELYVDGKNLSAGNVECLVHEDGRQEVTITVYNASNRTYRADSFAVAAIAPATHVVTHVWDAGRAPRSLDGRLPDGRMMHVLDSLPTLYAHSIYNTSFGVGHGTRDWRGPVPDARPKDEPVNIVLRVLTEAGTRDYPLVVRAGLGPASRLRSIRQGAQKQSQTGEGKPTG